MAVNRSGARSARSGRGRRRRVRRMDLRLDGKVALVTGASTGDRQGHRGRAGGQRGGGDAVVAQDRRPRGGGRRDPVGRPAPTSTCSRPTPASPTRPRPASRPRSARFGRVDILVNNAATNPYMGPIMDIDTGRFDKTVAVNWRGPLVWTPGRLAGLDGRSTAAWCSTSPRSAACRSSRRSASTTAPRRRSCTSPGTLALELSPGVRVQRHRSRPGQDRHGPGPVGAQRGGHRPPHAGRPAGRARRHRQRGRVPVQRRRVVDHRHHPGRRRRATAAAG